MNRIVFALGTILLATGVGVVFYPTTSQVPHTDCYPIGVVYSNGTGTPFVGYRCLTPDPTSVYSYAAIPTTAQTTRPFISDGILLAVVALVTMVVGYAIPPRGPMPNTDKDSK